MLSTVEAVSDLAGELSTLIVLMAWLMAGAGDLVSG